MRGMRSGEREGREGVGARCVILVLMGSWGDRGYGINMNDYAVSMLFAVLCCARDKGGALPYIVR
jgi:hypothetical protein